MERSEDWAVEYGRIAAFFRSQSDVRETEDGFAAEGCEILLTRLEDHRIGSLHFPKTNILLRGTAQDVNRIYHRFFMRFVSAGG